MTSRRSGGSGWRMQTWKLGGWAFGSERGSVDDGESQLGSCEALTCPWTLARRGWTLRRRLPKRIGAGMRLNFPGSAAYCLRYESSVKQLHRTRTSVAMWKDDLRRIFDACDREGTLDNIFCACALQKLAVSDATLPSDFAAPASDR